MLFKVNETVVIKGGYIGVVESIRYCFGEYHYFMKDRLIGIPEHLIYAEKVKRNLNE